MRQPIQQQASDPLHLRAFVGAQFWCRTGKKAEKDELLLAQRPGQLQQVLEQRLNVPAASVAGLDQLLELDDKLNEVVFEVQRSGSPAGRDRCLARSVIWLRGSAGSDIALVTRTRAVPEG